MKDNASKMHYPFLKLGLDNIRLWVYIIYNKKTGGNMTTISVNRKIYLSLYAGTFSPAYLIVSNYAPDRYTAHGTLTDAAGYKWAARLTVKSVSNSDEPLEDIENLSAEEIIRKIRIIRYWNDSDINLTGGNNGAKNNLSKW